MRLTKFHELVNDEFGQAYAAVLLKDLALTELSDQTANTAIAGGEDPRTVWLALCRATGVPAERWHGFNKKSKSE